MYFCTKITDDVTWIGVNDRKTERFENYIPLPHGVTYNSYFIDDEKTCVIDGVEIGSASTFLDKIVDCLGGRELNYVVVNHVEPDHSSGLKEVVKVFPNVKIVGNAKTIGMLKAFCIDFPEENYVTVKEGEILDLGKHKLTFAMMPMVHWPESMSTYDTTDKILFSNDAFGSFGALDGGIFDDQVNFDFYEGEMRRYYSNIVGKYGVQVINVIKKLAKLELKYICPSHGLIWRDDIPKVISLYENWAKFEPEAEGVVIVYGSMYGNTAKMAEVLGRKLNCCGIKEVKIYDASKTDHTFIISEIWKYKGLMIGSCAHNNSVYPKVQPLLHKLGNYGLKNRYLGIFGTMMWSGGGVRGIQAFADELKGIEVVGEPVEVKGTPKAEDIAKLEAIAEEMAAKLIAERL
ncbi:Nitric oxide reductase [Fusobacterium sp. DD29]|uniref:FprA family A-type flavoprotein n=1 Tax=unclassified Fusobacterium TaxID=2648384 RepID=UPI001B8AADC4|nr:MULTISPECIES: FprA family A-type flavoprotein [unclassified Fusobacterium]MBR8701530.1 Nitric oxide reductase [Fusobacterium sp. DD45]MBR8711267.1 Nitric oxide reductase [Fusobacterium sp. DD28]MBR8750124.1 Nitric oxide reductase [Fusobacterium sp. DD29]MBR8751816.1 Nitric oxide reductase [Fusobacterium sp. DD26]MBR8762351.1 Nitric oxide reductase [Fusobacterium sp. DD25]